MLKHVLYASAALALLAAPSMAANSGSVAVSGNVAAVCNMAYTSAAVAVGAITVDAQGINVPQTKSDAVGTDGYTFCNTNTATIQITVVPLKNTLPVSGTFTNIIPYTVTLPGYAPLASGTAPLGTAYPATTVGTFSQHIAATDVVTVDTAVATGPVIAGDYAGTVSIVLAP